MLPSERVKAALARQDLDRPPISFWGHDYFAEWFPTKLAASTLAAAGGYGWDWIKLHGRLSVLAESLGAAFRPHPSGETHPMVLRKRVERRADWFDVIDRAERTDLDTVLQEQLNVLRTVREAVGEDMPIVQTVFSPASVAGHLLGRDQNAVRRWLADDPGLMSRVLTAISGYIGRFAQAALAEGADGVFHAIFLYATSDFMSEEEYRQTLLPYDQAVLEQAAAGWLNIVHPCGARIHFDLADALPVAALSWSVHDHGNPDVDEAHARTDKGLVTGVRRDEYLLTGTPQEAYEEGLRLRAASVPGLMLSPDCSVSPWTRLRSDNLHELLRGVRD